MTHRILPGLASLALLAVATGGVAPAPAVAVRSQAEPEGRPCFTAAEIHNFRSAGDQTLYLRIRVSEVFEIGASPCPGLAFANGLNIRPDGPSDQLCVGDRARIAPTGRGTAAVTCNIRVERKLTREQVSALPDSAQP